MEKEYSFKLSKSEILDILRQHLLTKGEIPQSAQIKEIVEDYFGNYVRIVYTEAKTSTPRADG